MKLYYAPGACSLADHIALREAGMTFELDKVDLKAKTTAGGEDFRAVNPKGYVPALRLDDGSVLTENIALLDWIATQHPDLAPPEPIGRTRQLELLAYISTELHKSFAPFFKGGSDEEKAKAKDAIGQRFAFIAEHMKGDYLFGESFTVADAYLFVMLTWADKMGIEPPATLTAFARRMRQRPAVRAALEQEGLPTS